MSDPRKPIADPVHAEAQTELVSEPLETFLPDPKPEVETRTRAAAAEPTTNEPTTNEPTTNEPAPLVGLRSARLVRFADGEAEIQIAGERATRMAIVAEDVDLEVIEEAFEVGDRVLLEPSPEGVPLLIGVVRSRKPEVLRLRAERIEIEAEREVLIRSNTAALRLREDGDVEVVGSRISAASRGLFRLVGRMLRLN